VSFPTNGKWLAGPASAMPLTLEAFFATTGSDAEFIVVKAATGSTCRLGMAGGGTGKVSATFSLAGGGTVFVRSSGTFNDGAWHHAAVVFHSAATSSAVLFIDGVAVALDTSLTAGAPLTMGGTLTLSLGLHSGVRSSFTLAHAALHTTELAADRIASHYEAGTTGFVNETAAARLARYAAYAGVAAADTDFETGHSPLVHIDTTGMTALALMRLVETTEGGVLFDGLDGTLKFHDRAHRYAATSAFTVDYAAGEVANALSPVDDDQQQVNDMTATNTAGVSARVVDQPSKNEHGEYKDAVDLLTTDPDEPLNRASWVVDNHKEPAVRISEVEINLKTASDTLAAGVLAAELGTSFILTGLPANAPASSMRLFVEGRSERITADEDRVTLRTSPAEIYDVWILGDSVYGKLGETTRLAY